MHFRLVKHLIFYELSTKYGSGITVYDTNTIIKNWKSNL